MEDILNFVLAAVSSRLHTLYPGTAVYAESIPEELPETCFLIGYTGNQEIHKNLPDGIRYPAPWISPITRQIRTRICGSASFKHRHFCHCICSE